METNDEQKIEEGKSALRRAYHESMRSFAKEILRDAKENGYEDYDDARDYIDEKVDGTADGTSWVIYTHQALDVLVVSDNWQEIDEMDELGELPNEISAAITHAAYFAVRADIWEYIEAFQDEYFREENPKRKKGSRKKSTKLRSKLLR